MADFGDCISPRGRLIEDIDSGGGIVGIQSNFLDSAVNFSEDQNLVCATESLSFGPTERSSSFETVQVCHDPVSVETILVKEAEFSELLGTTVFSEEEAFQLYNDYAFRIGFGVRYSTLRKRDGGSGFRGREFCCTKQGLKKNKGVDGKQFTKVDIRTNCKARIYFEIKSSGEWVVVRHLMDHNHQFCPNSLVHHVRSHRSISSNELDYLHHLKKQGVKIADGFRCLQAEAGGSPSVGFLLRDAYNELTKQVKKSFDGSDANTLINIFKNRQSNEEDFFFSFEIDVDGSLVSFFWRDKKMKEDYLSFGELVIHDTTYRTNKYDMICGPFVGINHHTHTCMFGCGFLLNERIESFEWLFTTFLNSMDFVHPKTIMTDQSSAMSAAIVKVFPSSRHRLCIWHIIENSKKRIRDLRNDEGFLALFDHVLKLCQTVAEFDHYWNRMVCEYKCSDNPWLTKLYEMREKWCPAFSKQFFSAGILSSQRSESTNNSISRKLNANSCLCDFYHFFSESVSQWRSNEGKDQQRCWDGFPEIAIPFVGLLHKASKVYTIDAYKLFEKEFLRGMSLKYELRHQQGSLMSYLVWMPQIDIFSHWVSFDMTTHFVKCSCEKFSEVGILCCHILRIYHIHCVEVIPDCYVLKRWTRSAKCVPTEQIYASSGTSNVLPSVWRMQMQKKFHKLLCSSDSNSAARHFCEESFTKLKVDVEEQVGSIYFSDSESSTVGLGSAISNPKSSRKKGERNVRRKSLIEIKTNQARAKKKSRQASTSETDQANL
ncbi:unnamed protein product [Cuscuta epithymum]|uniref:SWIM-type domain-containing protein n=3 Tax=Cuscuta epithymum TaxID=186058 RepID=A0AAV0F2I6_9ASTE|nr:unnamed protein product [Cuscuta epithymum]